MTSIFSISLLSFLAIAISICSSVKPDQKEQYERPKMESTFTKSRISIDGRLDEKAWKSTEWSSKWVDLASCEPGVYDTQHMTLWDETYLYFGAKLMDPNVVASVTKENQRLFQYDNTFELFLDPGADGLNYYEFQMNAHGAKWQLSLDKKYKDGGNPTDPDMIEGIKAAVHIEGTLNDDSDQDQYWSVEIAIPWKSLKRFNVADDVTDQIWKVNLSRVFQTGEEAMAQKYWVWSCTEVMDMHQPHLWGTLRFAK